MFVNVPEGADFHIYTVSGELVRAMKVGGGTAYWGFTNAAGERVAPGLYYVTASAGYGRARARLIVLP